jgi:hypothetical protein
VRAPTTKQQTGAAMTNPDAAYCIERAEANGRMADQSPPSEYKLACLDLAERWRKLALSYEFADRMNQVSASLACGMDDRK